jgi:glycosyltransferase involved in cell wall biosynthesis
MIPTYNCAEYLQKTLSSVLEQDPGPDVMQIEVVDDHSTEDDPASVVEELGGSRVGFFRQAQNVGRDRNFESCLLRARGELVHLLHGDDWVLDGFYRRVSDGFSMSPRAGMAMTRHAYADAEGHWQSISPLERREAGILENWLPTIASGQRIATPSVVVRRAVYEHLGGFDRRLRTSEDWEMWVRIAANYPVWYDPEPLAVYRMQRPGALTDDASIEARLVEDMRRAVDVIAEYLPNHMSPSDAGEALKRARAMYARWGLEGARASAWAGGLRRTIAHSREALICSRHPRVVASVALELARATYFRGRRGLRAKAFKFIGGDRA